jgi:Cof subfamily protein (haloacid dehalogenase superfamily)
MNNTERLKNIKIIVSDLDGTLLSDSGVIGIETKQLISQLQDCGVIFALATGRLHSAVTGIARELSIKSPIISLDGSMIRSTTDGSRIYESFVKVKHVRRALRFAEEQLLNIVLCHDEAIYYTDRNSNMPMLSDKYGAKYKEVTSYDNYIERTLEVVLFSDAANSMRYVRDRFLFPFSVGSSISFYKSHRRPNISFLEIRRSGSTKGKGFERLLKHLKIKPNQAAVLGDWYNDISLFETNAFKVAVANAIPEIKRMADMVTSKSNNDEGAAKFFKKVLKAKRD